MHLSATGLNWSGPFFGVLPFCVRMLSLLTLTASLAFGKDLKPYEQKAFSRLGRAQHDFGALQNPPAGSISAKAKAIDQHVRDTILKLRPDLFEKYQLSIGVYASNNPNAFMSRVSPHQSRFIFREYYGFDTKKPIYQLGITYGLYNLLSSLDEVEAVIAHELIHLLEGHVDKETETRRQAAEFWFATERYEAVTDHLALGLMVGKVDLNALRDALWKLAEYKIARERKNSNEWSSLLDGAKGALSSHHDRGVRIGMVQAEAERLRNQDFKAQSLQRRAIPMIMKSLGNPREPSLSRTLTPEEQNKLARLTIQMAERITRGDSGFLTNIAWLFREAQNEDLHNIENRKTSNLNPDERTSLETAEKLQEMILSDDSTTREQKIALLFISSTLSNRRAQDGMPSMQYYHIFATAILKVIADRPVDWMQVVNMTHLNPEYYLTGALPAMVSVSKEGRKLYRLAFETSLFTDNHDPDNWPTEKISDRLRIRALGNQIINFPFEKPDPNEKPNPQPFKSHLKRIYLEELDRLTPYLHSKTFRDTVFSTREGNDFEEFIFFLSNREGVEDRTHPEIRKTKFMTTALAMMPECIEWGNRFKMDVFNRIAAQSTALSEKDIKDIHDAFRVTYYIPLRPVEADMLKKIYFNVLETLFNSSTDVDIESIERFLEKIIQMDAVPIGNRQQNIYTLLMLALVDIPGENQKRVHYEQLLSKIVANLGLEEVKRLVFAAPLPIYEQRFQAKLNSETYQQKKRDYLLAKALQEDPKLSVPEQMNYAMEAAFLRFYFVGMNSYSEDSRKTTFGILKLLNLDPLRSESLKKFELSDIDRAFRNFYQMHSDAVRRSKLSYPKLPEKDGDGDKNGFNEIRDMVRNASHIKEVAFLLTVFAQHQHKIKDLKTWARMYRSLLTISSSAIDTVPDLKESFEKRFLELSRNGQDPTAYLYIRGPKMRNGLTELSLVPALFEEFKRQVGNSKDPKRLREIFLRMDIDQKIKSDLTDIYEPLREKIAEDFRLQPNEIDLVFPDSDTKINTKNTEGLDGEIRGLSGIISYTRHRNLEEQLQLMEYLMGRRGDFPEFVSKWQKDTTQPITSILYGMKLRLSRESDLVRAFTLNMLVTGPDGFAEKKGAEEYLLNYFFKDSENKEIATELTQALLKSMGRDKSFAYSYILAQKSKDSQKMDEGEILKALLEVVFGVPGKKLGQYLAFVGELGSLRDALAKLQDSASPLSYLEILKLVNKQMGLSFSERWEVVRALGSGSVNVAIEILAKKGADQRVISVLRDSIQVSAANDFRRLQSLVIDLAEKNPTRYGFLPGLLKIIEKSVSLEFNKDNSFNRQKDATAIYNKQVNGWTLKSPAVYEQSQFAVEMEKATGKTAVKIRKQNFAVYRETMRIVLEAEFEHLLNSHLIFGRHLTSLAFANPDLHDGQVIIDSEKKIITVLDFGQAVKISRTERDIGLMIIRMLAQTDDTKDFAAQILNLQKAFKAKNPFTIQEIQNAFAKKDLMDRFIYFLGIAGNHDWNVSIATVHFILGMNRLLKLSDVVGYDLTRRLTTVLKTRELTRSTELGATLEGLLKSHRKLTSDLRTCQSLFQ